MPDNPLKEYVCLLIDLHFLDIEGKNDSTEADALRERMDKPYAKLSKAQIELVEKFSIDLYKCQEREEHLAF